MTAAEITAHLGVEPDNFSFRGSRRRDPVRPVAHAWNIRCDRVEMTVDEQIRAVIDRLRPHRQKVADLIEQLSGDEPPGLAVLQVVRYFDDEDGVDEVIRITELSTGGQLESLPGQHQLLGWHLDMDVIEFLRSVSAEMDVDEYG
jgi:hypothetical protein